MPTAGPKTAVVQQRKQLLRSLERTKIDAARAQKELVAAKEVEGLITDPITGECFRETSVVLTDADFTLGLNTANALTIVATYTVPNGVSYYFRGVKNEVDRNAPYLYGDIKNSAGTDINGTIRVRVYDASLNQLRGQPFTGTAAQLNNASPTNWFERLFFNSRVPVRANGGDKVVIDFTSAGIVGWTQSNFALHLLQLTKQQ